MLLHPDLGSFFFIGIVLTTAELAPDASLPDRCGSCTRCLDACPTGAFAGPYVLDARRCISYLTIEHRGSIAPELRPGVGAWTFGCDECQTACPWNGRAPVTGEPAFGARRHLPPTELLSLDEAEYREIMRGSPLKRARREGLARNAAIALGNAGTDADVPALGRALGRVEPAVRAHAAWALGRIGGETARAALLAARSREGDAGAVGELERALAQLTTTETEGGRHP
jgi:epoxyqueuosine reductase